MGSQLSPGLAFRIERYYLCTVFDILAMQETNKPIEWDFTGLATVPSNLIENKPLVCEFLC